MFQKKRVLYFIICFAFILALLLSNKIVAALNHNNVTKTSENLESFEKDKVFFWVDGINYYKDLYESFFISGWAFCETTLDNSQKEVWILLVNDKAIYKHKIDLNNRNDIRAAFIKDHKIRDTNHGISGTISTINVKNGIYKVYFYCKENNENYGLVDTGKVVQKDNNGISEYVWYSSIHDVKENVTGKYAKSNIENVDYTDGEHLQISGWAFVEGQNTENQSVYVRLTDEKGNNMTYDTQKWSRADVGTAFNSHLYDNSGFVALIPKEELQNGKIVIELLVNYSNNIYLADSNYIYPTDNSSVKPTGANVKEKVNTEIKIDTKSIVQDDSVKNNIDSCSADEFLQIKGWSFVENAKASDTKVYLSVTSANGTTHVYQADKLTRPDVAKHFKNELYTESGFKASIPLEAISKGENTIVVIADNGKMLKALKSYTFKYGTEENK